MPRPTVRAAVGARYGLESLHEDIQGLLTAKLDALVIAAPDSFHPALAIAGLEAGPPCDVREAAGAHRRRAATGSPRRATASGRVLQVAYMKRYDPAYRRALELLPDSVEEVKLISVEVNDPDHEPFVAHLPMTWPNDIPAALREQARTETTAQLREAAGGKLDEAGARALSGGFLSSLVHDVAVVHGMLAHMRRRAAGGGGLRRLSSIRAAACSWASACRAAGESA